MKFKLAFFLALAILILAKFTYDNFRQPFGKGEGVPVFSLPDIENNIIQLDNFRGTPLIIYFWATWCPTCVEKMPSLDSFAKKHPEIIILTISEDGDVNRVKKFFEGNSPSFKILFDEGGHIADIYNSYKVPQSYLVDKDGNFIHQISSDVSWDDSETSNKILTLLRKTPKNTE